MPKITLCFPDDFPDRDLAGDKRELNTDGHPDGFEWVLGRHLICFIRIANGQISAKHCSFRYSKATERWEMCDLASTNGTWLEGKKLPACNYEPIAPQARFYLANPLFSIYCLEDEDDTLHGPVEEELGEETVVAPPPPAQQQQQQSRTLADLGYEALYWVGSAKTWYGQLWRIVLVAGLIVLAIVLIHAL